MRLLIDVNLPVALACCLREAGHEAVHLFERGQERLPGPEILAVAGSEARVVVTCDLDFGALNALSRGGPVSAIVIRGRDLRTRTLFDRLSRLLPLVEADLDAGALVIVEPGRHRIRRLPIRAGEGPRAQPQRRRAPPISGRISCKVWRMRSPMRAATSRKAGCMWWTCRRRT